MAKTPEELREYMREYARKRRACDPVFLEKCREAGRKSREKRRDIAIQEAAAWKAANKDRVIEYAKQYAVINKEKIKQQRKQRQEKNFDKYKEVAKAWKEKNVEKLREWNRVYTATRYKSDPIFKLKLLQRTRVRAVLKNNKKVETHKLLGCSYQELKDHIEAQFINGMTWENMGEWHIDHIIPLAAFDLTDERQQMIAFNYKNLQPLWAIENLKKGAKRA